MSSERKTAIEFAKYLLDRDVTRHTAAVLPKLEGTTYRPPEYDLLRGELEVNGEAIYNDFIEIRKQYIIDMLYQQTYEELERVFTKNFMNSSTGDDTNLTMPYILYDHGILKGKENE